MRTETHIYHHGELELHGYLAYNDAITTPRPAVMIIHDWSGRNVFSCQQAERLANLGYIGFAVDMYGLGRCGDTVAEKQALMQPLISNRHQLAERITAAFDAMILHEGVDKQRIAVIGFCFGGLCALDLARSGAPIVAAVSVHGLLNRDPDLKSKAIEAKILALHGYDDPMVTTADVNAFCQEMTHAGVDWQTHIYGQTQHGFTNPHAHDHTLGTVYHAQAALRAHHAIDSFLQEVFI